MPGYGDARRNLGMAYLESGQIDEAKRTLVESVRMFPNDTWGYVLLANLHAKYEVDRDAAELWYRKALSIDPSDIYALTSYGGVLLEMGRRDSARELFRQVIASGIPYPNAYYGLALMEQQDGNLEKALTTLEGLFDADQSRDVRGEPVYAEARRLYAHLCAAVSDRDHERLMGVVQERKGKLEGLGEPIVIQEDNSLQGIQATVQRAWTSDLGHHLVRYNSDPPTIVPHLIAHELVHLELEYAARAAGTNRLITSTSGTREFAIRSISADIRRLARQGISEERLTPTVLEWADGLVRQLFNHPLDMFIEHRLFEELPELRATQLVSLMTTNASNRAAIADDRIRRVTPRTIYDASAALNAAYALFCDELLGGRTRFSQAYEERQLRTGGRLLAAWHEAADSFAPGDEYALVDEFARILRLERWYEWQREGSEESPAEDRIQGTTNPELLKSREMATVMYLLDALKRFSAMETSEVAQVGMEIGLLGQNGIDYASPDEQYSVSAFPSESFSGLHMLALMYVAFKQIDPSTDTGLDFEDAYRMALTLYKPNE